MRADPRGNLQGTVFPSGGSAGRPRAAGSIAPCGDGVTSSPADRWHRRRRQPHQQGGDCRPLLPAGYRPGIPVRAGCGRQARSRHVTQLREHARGRRSLRHRVGPGGGARSGNDATGVQRQYRQDRRVRRPVARRQGDLRGRGSHRRRSRDGVTNCAELPRRRGCQDRSPASDRPCRRRDRRHFRLMRGPFHAARLRLCSIVREVRVRDEGRTRCGQGLPRSAREDPARRGSLDGSRRCRRKGAAEVCPRRSPGVRRERRFAVFRSVELPFGVRGDRSAVPGRSVLHSGDRCQRGRASARRPARSRRH